MFEGISIITKSNLYLSFYLDNFDKSRYSICHNLQSEIISGHTFGCYQILIFLMLLIISYSCNAESCHASSSYTDSCDADSRCVDSCYAVVSILIVLILIVPIPSVQIPVITIIALKMKFSFKVLFSKCDQPQIPADLVTFTEEILNEKFHFLRSGLPLPLRYYHYDYHQADYYYTNSHYLDSCYINILSLFVTPLLIYNLFCCHGSISKYLFEFNQIKVIALVSKLVILKQYALVIRKQCRKNMNRGLTLWEMHI